MIANSLINAKGPSPIDDRSGFDGGYVWKKSDGSYWYWWNHGWGTVESYLEDMWRYLNP